MLEGHTAAYCRPRPNLTCKTRKTLHPHVIQNRTTIRAMSVNIITKISTSSVCHRDFWLNKPFLFYCMYGRFRRIKTWGTTKIATTKKPLISIYWIDLTVSQGSTWQCGSKPFPEPGPKARSHVANILRAAASSKHGNAEDEFRPLSTNKPPGALYSVRARFPKWLVAHDLINPEGKLFVHRRLGTGLSTLLSTRALGGLPFQSFPLAFGGVPLPRRPNCGRPLVRDSAAVGLSVFFITFDCRAGLVTVTLSSRVVGFFFIIWGRDLRASRTGAAWTIS